ncbi:hypothetical protein amrb99_52150 [Actinomadura sp. RB99]|uniref:hypothetical protein n=1 Tax=Actinomadura sp. RB99 TaxID=2691577 RepID=UPI0016898E35|nr:hypothetical protein [Actinomadura sp. RB99]MBD2896269.1 hypothetical protein [Actinomadura sp. RB99]
MTTPNAPRTDNTSRPVVPGDLFTRHQVISGLRALADFLEANPAVPVPEYGDTFDVFPRDCDDACSVALVNDVAELLGVAVDDDRPFGGHYTASKSFGRIAYRIVHIPDRNRREYEARMSYRDNVRVDEESAAR